MQMMYCQMRVRLCRAAAIDDTKWQYKHTIYQRMINKTLLKLMRFN
ncbi:hypothetical protein [Moraxella lacunata]